MKISTKGRYALRLMLDLAMSEGNTPVSIKDIAGRQQISEKYMEQIISVLNRAGYVRSVRGANGGYLLTKEAAEYTVGMILRLTEGDLAPVGCVGPDSDFCDRKDACITVRIWEKINDAIESVVDHITLQDLVQWQRENE